MDKEGREEKDRQEVRVADAAPVSPLGQRRPRVSARFIAVLAISLVVGLVLYEGRTSLVRARMYAARGDRIAAIEWYGRSLVIMPFARDARAELELAKAGLETELRDLEQARVAVARDLSKKDDEVSLLSGEISTLREQVQNIWKKVGSIEERNLKLTAQVAVRSERLEEEGRRYRELWREAAVALAEKLGRGSALAEPFARTLGAEPAVVPLFLAEEGPRPGTTGGEWLREEWAEKAPGRVKARVTSEGVEIERANLTMSLTKQRVRIPALGMSPSREGPGGGEDVERYLPLSVGKERGSSYWGILSAALAGMAGGEAGAPFEKMKVSLSTAPRILGEEASEMVENLEEATPQPEAGSRLEELFPVEEEEADTEPSIRVAVKHIAARRYGEAEAELVRCLQKDPEDAVARALIVRVRRLKEIVAEESASGTEAKGAE